jgi:UDP-N-acetylbacillosamine N-acetyltransferase
MNKNEVYIIGAGGHTRSLINLLNDYEIKGVLDDSYSVDSCETIMNIPLVDTLNNMHLYSDLIISSGNPEIKKKWYDKCRNQLLKKNLIHHSSIIEKYASLGECNQIMAYAYINSEVQIQNNNLINTSSIIEHEVLIGSHNHISIGVKIGGRSVIGDCCFVGAGAVIVDKISISNHVTIGANSLVLYDIKEPGTYVGSPVKKIK